MTRKDDFVMLVQTAAIVESLSHDEQSIGSNKPSSVAAIAVNTAIQVSEEKLPDSLTEACDELIAHVYENTVPKPAWLIGIL
ncbi:MAG: hypothetical protein GY847_35910 [Proteobacteria bacterium]|nr:hypothetical protein [Pseudomonadota bacterium]